MNKNQCVAKGGKFKDGKCQLPSKYSGMIKKYKKNKVVWVAGLVILVIVIFALFGFPLSVLYIPKNQIQIQSDFIAKGGINKPYYDMVRDAGLLSNLGYNERDASYIKLINDVINNVYGYSILDAPIKLDKRTRDNLVKSMKSINKEMKMNAEVKKMSKKAQNLWRKSFGTIFSSILINTISKSQYTTRDVIRILIELDKSANKFCSGLSTVIRSNEFNSFINPNTDDIQTYIQLCQNKPKNMITKIGDKYKVILGDIPIYTYQYAKPICEEKQVCVPPLPCEVGQYCIQRDECQVIKMCYMDPKSRQKVLVGNIMLSKLNFEISAKGIDTQIALGTNAINEADKIPYQRVFSNYIGYTNHENAIPFSGTRDLICGLDHDVQCSCNTESYQEICGSRMIECKRSPCGCPLVTQTFRCSVEDEFIYKSGFIVITNSEQINKLVNNVDIISSNPSVMVR